MSAHVPSRRLHPSCGCITRDACQLCAVEKRMQFGGQLAIGATVPTPLLLMALPGAEPSSHPWCPCCLLNPQSLRATTGQMASLPSWPQDPHATCPCFAA